MAGFDALGDIDIIPLVQEYCYSDRPRMRQVLDRLVTEDGLLDPLVLDDTDDFVRTLSSLASNGEADSDLELAEDEE